MALQAPGPECCRPPSQVNCLVRAKPWTLANISSSCRTPSGTAKLPNRQTAYARGSPRYNYDDMVLAQYRLVTEGLGLRHVRMVLGFSMGGMNTWIWGEEVS